MIYEVEKGSFVISSHQSWMPGCYNSKRAANYAFRFPDEVLSKLMDQAIQAARVINFEDLQKTRKEMVRERTPKWWWDRKDARRVITLADRIVKERL